MAVPASPFLYTTTPQKTYPLTTGVAIPSPVGAWANSAWIELIAATPDAWSVTGVCVDANSNGLDRYEVDVGIGAAGFETVVATVTGLQGVPRTIPLTIPGAWIGAGVRVAVRLRFLKGLGGFTFRVSLLYYEGVMDGRVVTTADPLLISAPLGATAVLSSVTPWVSGAWVQVSAATATLWAVEGVQISSIDDLSGTLPCALELDIGVGAGGSEVVATTVRWSTRIFTQREPAVATLWPILTIQAGSRVAVRIRISDAHILTCRVTLLYLASATGLETVSTYQKTEWFPPAANSLSMTTPASAWTNSTWTEVTPATSAALAITGVAVDAINSGNSEVEVDVGQGAASAEVVIATFRYAQDNIASNGSDHTILRLLQAQAVAAGVRLAIRVRTSDPLAITVKAAVGYIATPQFSQQANNPQYVYPPSAAGVTLLQPLAVAWTNSPWGQLVAATAADVLLTGVSFTTGAIAELIAEIGMGAAGLETVITLVRAQAVNLTNLWFALPVPHYVPQGTRLSIRFRRNVAAGATYKLSATYLGIPPDPTPPPEPPVTLHHAIRRLRRAPHISADQVRMKYDEFQLDFEAGGARSDHEAQLQFGLRWSKDGGHTWSNLHWIPAGRIGEYTFRALWRRIGVSRDMVFEVINTDAAKIVLLQAFVQATPGLS